MTSLPDVTAFTVEFPDDGIAAEISFAPLVLRLRHLFGTSHSSTMIRNNALFSCTLKPLCADVVTSGVRRCLEHSVTGYGEAGLPPQKPKCYLASVEDCKDFVDRMKRFYRSNPLQDTTDESHSADPIAWVRTATALVEFGLVRGNDQQQHGCASTTSSLYRVCCALLRLVDGTASRPEDRAAKSGVEAAIFDAWCKALRVPFYTFCVGRLESATATVPRTYPCRSFYTSALNEDVKDMIESARFGLQFTPCLKIKLNDDVARCMSILERFVDERLGLVWSLDANAAWSIDVAEEYVRRIEAMMSAGRLVGAGEQKKRCDDAGGGNAPRSQNEPLSTPPAHQSPVLYMIEQPFSVEYVPGADAATDARWRAFRLKLNTLGVLVYGDESIATSDDVATFHRGGLVDGVNIKLEKAGGIRASLHAASLATQLGLRVWIGTMVSTCLGCSQAAQVAVAAAQDCDADGGLLTFPDHFTGGFVWSCEDGGSVVVAGMTAPPDGALRDDEAIFGFGVQLVAAGVDG